MYVSKQAFARELVDLVLLQDICQLELDGGCDIRLVGFALEILLTSLDVYSW
jgi:hypothetical protein